MENILNSIVVIHCIYVETNHKSIRLRIYNILYTGIVLRLCMNVLIICQADDGISFLLIFKKNRQESLLHKSHMERILHLTDSPH